MVNRYKIWYLNEFSEAKRFKIRALCFWTAKLKAMWFLRNSPWKFYAVDPCYEKPIKYSANDVIKRLEKRGIKIQEEE